MSVTIGGPVIHRVCRSCGFRGEWPGRWKACTACQAKA